MAKYKVNIPFVDKDTSAFIDKGSIFEADAKRAKEINENLSWYAEDKGVEAILTLEKAKKESEGA